MAFRPVRLTPCRALLAVVCLVGGVVLIVRDLPVSAQQIQVWPSFRDANGPTIEIETEDNVRCRYSSGARPSFSVAGLTSNANNAVNASIASNSNSNSAIGSQLGGGVLLTIPFGSGAVDGCGRLKALQEHRTRLALGAALLEQGLITQEQFQQLGASIAKQIGIPAGGGASVPAASRPVYVPPPPLNTGPATSKPSGNRPIGSPASPGAAVKQRFSPLNTGAGATPQQPGRPKPLTGTPPPG
jgi:hypothetical protein